MQNAFVNVLIKRHHPRLERARVKGTEYPLPFGGVDNECVFLIGFDLIRQVNWFRNGAQEWEVVLGGMHHFEIVDIMKFNRSAQFPAHFALEILQTNVSVLGRDLTPTVLP